MIHGIDERDQLARLHDRHKRFSIDVYDHSKSGNHMKLKEAQTKLKEVESELNDFKTKLHPNTAIQ